MSSSTGISSLRESSSPAWMPAQPVDRARERHAGADDAVAVDAGLGQHGRCELGGGVEGLVRDAVDVELDVLLCEDGGGEVGDGHPHVPVAEVDADCGAGRGVEP